MQHREHQVLGRDMRGPIGAEQLDAVPWGHGDTDTTVEFTTNELTATCPLTGQPDFYGLKLIYRPRETLIESKILKLYLWGFTATLIRVDPEANSQRGQTNRPHLQV